MHAFPATHPRSSCYSITTTKESIHLIHYSRIIYYLWNPFLKRCTIGIAQGALCWVPKVAEAKQVSMARFVCVSHAMLVLHRKLCHVKAVYLENLTQLLKC